VVRLLSLAFATYTSLSSGVIITVTPVEKSFMLTAMCPPRTEAEIKRVIDFFDGEQGDDIMVGDLRYASYQVTMLTRTIHDTLTRTSEMFPGMALSDPAYRYSEGGDASKPLALIIDPLTEQRQYTVDMPLLPKRLTAAFTRQARTMSNVRGCTIDPTGDNARATLKMMPGGEPIKLMDRLAQAYSELAAAN
jgi:hypothetical protein